MPMLTPLLSIIDSKPMLSALSEANGAPLMWHVLLQSCTCRSIHSIGGIKRGTADGTLKDDRLALIVFTFLQLAGSKTVTGFMQPQ